MDVKSNTSSYIGLLLVIIVGSLTAVWYAYTPLTVDDLRLTLMWTDYALGHNSQFDWSEYVKWLGMMFGYDSFRLFNLLSPLIILFLPHWLFGVLTGAGFAGALWLGARISGVGSNKIVWLGVLTLLIEFALPWYDYMNTVVFALNYVWVLLPSVLWLFIYQSDSKPSVWSWVGVVALSIVTGFLNELVTCSVIGGVVVYHLARRKWLSRKQVVMMACLAISGVIMIAIEVLGKYKGNEIDPLGKSLIDFIYPLVSQGYMVVALIGILLLVACRRRLSVLSASTWMLSGVAVTGLLITLVIPGYGSRIYFFLQFFAVLALVSVCMTFIGNVKMGKLYRDVGAVAVWGLVIWHLTASCVFTAKVGDEVAAIERGYLFGDEPRERFYPMTTTRDIPLIVWNKGAAASIVTSQYAWPWHPIYYANAQLDYPIPVELRDIDRKNLEKIPGNNPMFRYEGYWIMPDVGNNVEMVRVYYKILKVNRKLPLNNSKFVDINGNKWVYLFEERSSVTDRLLPVEHIDTI